MVGGARVRAGAAAAAAVLAAAGVLVPVGAAGAVSGDVDCSAFTWHEQAQAFFLAHGPGDPYRLDADQDGVACETLPHLGSARVQGADRYATATAISAALVPARASGQQVFVASGASFPDALSAAPVAVRTPAPTPLLLVPATGALPASVTAELDRLAPVTITVVGGSSAVSDGVLGQLQHWDAGAVRVAGTDRYDTSARVSQRGASTGGTVLLATGTGYPDALTGAAAAAHLRGSLLLTDPGQLRATTSAALRALAPDRVVVLGGTSAVSAAVEAQVRALLPGVDLRRTTGTDRYDTAAQVSASTYPGSAAGVLLATGLDFPDALAGGALAAARSEPLLLSRPGCAPPQTVAEARRLGVTTTTVLGGRGAVSDTAAALSPC